MRPIGLFLLVFLMIICYHIDGDTMKIKIIYIFIILFTYIPFVNALEIESSNAILYNLNNNEIIYEKNSSEKIKIASLTKIMTAIVAIENIDDINKKVTITYDMLKGLAEDNALVLGLKVGDIVTYEDLLYATLLPSAADAANALAITISGSISEFVAKMNEKANELGLVNTLFTNTTGIDFKDNHSTVNDVAILLKYALDNNTFKKIYQTKTYTTTNGISMVHSLEKSIKKYNLDIDYIKGAKTGYTDLAGLCLSSITDYNNINYLLVTCGADPSLSLPYNIIDSDKIYKYYFDNYHYRNILAKDKTIKKIENKYSDKNVNLVSNFDYSLYMLDSDYETLQYEYIGLEKIDIFTKDKIIGKYNVKLNDKIIKSIDIYKPDKIEFSLIKFLIQNIYVVISITIIILVSLIIFVRKKVLK